MNPEIKPEEITIGTTGPQSDLARFKEGKEQLTPEQKDWIRGVFDGAGSMNGSLKRRSILNRKVFAVVPRISLAGPDVLIREIQNIIGGHAVQKNDSQWEWYCEATVDKSLPTMIVFQRLLEILKIGNQTRNTHIALLEKIMDFHGNLDAQIQTAQDLSKLNHGPKPEQVISRSLSNSYVAGLMAVSGAVRRKSFGLLKEISCHVPTLNLANQLVIQFGGKSKKVSDAGDITVLRIGDEPTEITRNRMNARWRMSLRDGAEQFLENLTNSESGVPENFRALIH